MFTYFVYYNYLIKYKHIMTVFSEYILILKREEILRKVILFQVYFTKTPPKSKGLKVQLSGCSALYPHLRPP